MYLNLYQLHDPQVIYLQRVEHPVSGEDILLAMQCVCSPIFKDMLQKITMGAVTVAVIEGIIKHCMEANLMDKFEKLALVEHVLELYVMNVLLTQVNNLMAPHSSIRKLHNDIVNLRGMSENLCNRWKHALERQVIHTANALDENNVMLTVADETGKLITVSPFAPEGLAYIKSMQGAHSPEPVIFATTILQSHMLASENEKHDRNEKNTKSKKGPDKVVVTRNILKTAYYVNNELKTAFQHFAVPSENPEEKLFDYEKLLQQLRKNLKANSIIHNSMSDECSKIFDMSYVVAEELAQKNVNYYKLYKNTNTPTVIRTK